MSKGEVAGAFGIGVVIVAVVGVSILITAVTGRYSHWPFVFGGIFVGLMAVKAINR